MRFLTIPTSRDWHAAIIRRSPGYPPALAARLTEKGRRSFIADQADPGKRSPDGRQRHLEGSIALDHLHRAPDIINSWRRFYGSSAVLKSIRDCTMLGSSIGRVGLIDTTAGNAARLGASQRSRHATQRVAPHRYATLEPPGKPGGSRAFAADGLPQ
jgi:hypothetical protein